MEAAAASGKTTNTATTTTNTITFQSTIHRGIASTLDGIAVNSLDLPESQPEGGAAAIAAAAGEFGSNFILGGQLCVAVAKLFSQSHLIVIHDVQIPILRHKTVAHRTVK